MSYNILARASVRACVHVRVRVCEIETDRQTERACPEKNRQNQRQGETDTDRRQVSK